MTDGHGRKINYLRLSITDRCNLRCRYCMPSEGVEKKCHGDLLNYEALVRIVTAFSKLGIDKIRLTGGEPLVRKDIHELIQKIKKINGIRELVLTTNGLLLSDQLPNLKLAGLDRINISIDSLKKDKYAHITRGGDLSKVLRGIEEAIRMGMTPIKINVVLIKNFNVEEVIDFVNLTLEKPIDVRFIELMPTGEAASFSEERFVSNQDVLKWLPNLTPVVSDDLSAPAKYYKLPGAMGKVGLISPISCAFCDNCNRLRLTPDGKIKHCLHSNEELDIRPFLNDENAMIAEIETYIKRKPKTHEMDKGSYITRNMSNIGG